MKPTGRRGSPARGGTGVLWVLVALNVLVYVAWQLAASDPGFLDAMRDNFLVSLDAVRRGRVWTPLTSEISHYDPTHLLFNMIGLWVFGRDVARAIGQGRLALLYVAGALLASAGHLGWALVAGDSQALGASGAVMAIAVMFGAIHPHRTLLLNFFLPVPAWLAVVGYIALDAFGLFAPGSGIAHAAHLGGALFGLLYWLWLGRPRERAPHTD